MHTGKTGNKLRGWWDTDFQFFLLSAVKQGRGKRKMHVDCRTCAPMTENIPYWRKGSVQCWGMDIKAKNKNTARYFFLERIVPESISHVGQHVNSSDTGVECTAYSTAKYAKLFILFGCDFWFGTTCEFRNTCEKPTHADEPWNQAEQLWEAYTYWWALKSGETAVRSLHMLMSLEIRRNTCEKPTHADAVS